VDDSDWGGDTSVSQGFGELLIPDPRPRGFDSLPVPPGLKSCHWQGIPMARMSTDTLTMRADEREITRGHRIGEWRLMLEIPPIEGAIILLNRMGKWYCQQSKI
jgi:hypothetical protein